MKDMDRLSRHVPTLVQGRAFVADFTWKMCIVPAASPRYSGELDRAGLVARRSRHGT